MSCEHGHHPDDQCTECGTCLKCASDDALVVDKLPKCWRLVDGELVQDCVVVPSRDAVYYMCDAGLAHVAVEWYKGEWVSSVHCSVRVSDCANTPEAAKALAEGEGK